MYTYLQLVVGLKFPVFGVVDIYWLFFKLLSCCFCDLTISFSFHICELNTPRSKTYFWVVKKFCENQSTYRGGSLLSLNAFIMSFWVHLLSTTGLQFYDFCRFVTKLLLIVGVLTSLKPSLECIGIVVVFCFINLNPMTLLWYVILILFCF